MVALDKHTWVSVLLIVFSCISENNAWVTSFQISSFSPTNPRQHSSSTLFLSNDGEPWSCTADSDKDGAIQVKLIGKGDTAVDVIHNTTYSLSSPREWMESIENAQGRHGAYTVLRCEIMADGMKGKIWGEEFHLHRLLSSYKAMFFDSYSEESISLAIDQSRNMVQSLLDEARDNLEPVKGTKQSKIVMVTLLWQPQIQGHESTRKSSEGSILVRAHAFSSNVASIPANYDPNPIIAAIALSKDQSTHEALLPARYNSIPEAKSSSWCRIRRPLEEKFKVSNVGEVLLTMRSEADQNKGDSKDDWILLEGLTSNLFVVYKDGTIRTAGDYVLGGHARQMILEAANRIGLKISNEPVLLSDGRDGLWSEMFVTSAIRLVIPVGKLLCPDGNEEKNDDSFQEFWSESSLKNSSWDTRRWKLLYDDIIHSSK